MLLGIIAINCTTEASAQSSLKMGTDFWVTNLSYPTRHNGNVRSVSNLNLQIAAARQCTVHIASPNGWDTTITALQSQNTLVNLNYNTRDYSSELIHTFSFHITSTDSIAVFATSGNGGFFDKSLILPTRLLRDEYIVQTFEGSPHASEFQIIATEDNTVVTIIPTANTISGRQAGVPFSINLPSAGQCLQIISDSNSDFTGTQVKAADGKPIALFHGNSDAYIIEPDYTDPITHNNSAVLFEQAAPVSKWGKNFILPHNALGKPDQVVVLSSADNCAVYKNGQQVATLNARESYTYTADDDLATDYIVTTQPAYVTFFPQCMWRIPTANYKSSSMITVAPWEWKTKEICISTIPNSNTYSEVDCLLHVVAKNSETNSIELNGASIASSFQPVASAPQFSQATIEIPQGEYLLECEDCSGFTGYVTLMKYQTSGFTIGSAQLDNRRIAFDEDDIHEGSNGEATTCIGDSVTMFVTPADGIDSVRWFFGDGSSATGETVTHAYHQTGMHQLTAIVYSYSNDLFNPVDTLYSSLIVNGTDTTYRDTVVCGETMEWQGSVYHDGDTITTTYQNEYGCNNLNIITLHLIGEKLTELDTLIGCDYAVYRGNTYRNDTTVYDTVESALGCDSVIVCPIVILPSYSTFQEVTINDTSYYTWIDGRTYHESTTKPYVAYIAQNGCDSIIYLHLTVVPTPGIVTPDSSTLWVPNAFTPDENANKLFAITCNDVISAEVSVFSRQGLLVCTFDGLVSAWDGTHNGQPCPQGSYVYIINYRIKTQPHNWLRKTGTVLLLR